MRLLLSVFTTVFILASVSANALSVRNITDICNQANVLYGNNQPGTPRYPQLRCNGNNIIFQRTDLSYLVPVVLGGKFSERAANSACNISKNHNAYSIISNLSSLCELELGRGSCSSCN